MSASAKLVQNLQRSRFASSELPPKPPSPELAPQLVSATAPELLRNSLRKLLGNLLRSKLEFPSRSALQAFTGLVPTKGLSYALPCTDLLNHLWVWLRLLNPFVLSTVPKRVAPTCWSKKLLYVISASFSCGPNFTNKCVERKGELEDYCRTNLWSKVWVAVDKLETAMSSSPT